MISVAKIVNYNYNGADDKKAGSKENLDPFFDPISPPPTTNSDSTGNARRYLSRCLPKPLSIFLSLQMNKTDIPPRPGRSIFPKNFSSLTVTRVAKRNVFHAPFHKNPQHFDKTFAALFITFEWNLTTLSACLDNRCNVPELSFLPSVFSRKGEGICDSSSHPDIATFVDSFFFAKQVWDLNPRAFYETSKYLLSVKAFLFFLQ